ncbi:MAG TPA: hypothetical protein VFQ53_05080 [Kofleriaceae bacterium]|nr:hypothetical protein [Kofleriaceae bacterium]
MRARTELDAFFDPAAEPLAILRAVRALAMLSHGEVTRPDASPSGDRPDPESLFSEVVFGPLQELRCRCGKVVGEAHAGTRCEKCHVECASPRVRDERWAHIATGVPLLHPRLVPRIVALTGWTEDAVRSDEARPSALVERLAEARDDELAAAGFSPRDLLIERVPVVPPGDRPRVPQTEPSGDRWFARFAGLRLARDNEAYQRFAARASRVSRLVALGAPYEILGFEVADLQQRFDDLYAVLARPIGDPARSGVRPSLWQPADEPRSGPLELSEPPRIRDDWEIVERVTDVPLACGWIDHDRVLVQVAYAMFTVSTSSGAIAGPWRTGKLELRGVHHGRAVLVDRYAPERVAVLDPDAGWLAEAPDDLPLVFVENDQPEDGWLRDVKTGAIAQVESDLSGDRPHEIARTPDFRFLWVSSSPDDGAVHDITSGLCWLKLSALDLDRYEGPWLGDEALSDDDAGSHESAPAIARAYDRWRIFDCRGNVSHDGEQLFRIAREAKAAAFDASGDRLAIVGSDSLSVIDVPGARYVTQLDLRAQLADFATPETTLTDEQLAALLVAYGTLRAAAEADDAELATLPGIDDAAIAALRAV